jgi:hypothetical protein
MKYTDAIFIQTILFAIAVFILGQLVFENLFTFFEPSVSGIVFQIKENNTGLKSSILFSISLLLAPVMLLLVWLLSAIISPQRKIASVVTVFVCMCVGMYVRHVQVKTYFTMLQKTYFSLQSKADVIYPIDPANFVYYMFGGLCVGCIISYFLFRQKKM